VTPVNVALVAVGATPTPTQIGNSSITPVASPYVTLSAEERAARQTEAIDFLYDNALTIIEVCVVFGLMAIMGIRLFPKW
jgi:hypothetical protein